MIEDVGIKQEYVKDNMDFTVSYKINSGLRYYGENTRITFDDINNNE
jgi:hypothetical protein